MTSATTTTTTKAKKVIVYGATGAIGTTLIEIITRENPDWQVLAASRSGGASSHLAALQLANVQLIQGDIEDLENARVVTRDVDIVYCCIGFPQYETKYWAQHWPVVVHNLLEVTSATRPLVFCDNLYAYGPATNISTHATTVPPTLTSKPGVRATLRQAFLQRMKESPGSIVVVAGADFFGPRLEDKCFLGDPIIGAIVKGKRPMALGSVTAIHDFCCTKDFSNALYVVSTSTPSAMGRFWICPHSIQNKSVREITEMVYDMTGKTPHKSGVQVMPVFMLKLLGTFVPILKEMKEMMPFWTQDYTVDDSEFCKAFGVEATPAKEALQETIAYYQAKEAN